MTRTEAPPAGPTGGVAHRDVPGSEMVDAAVAALREVLRLVDSGEVVATASERAHLVGAVDALEALGRT